MGIAERMGAIIGIRPDNEKRVIDIERLIGAYEANTDILVRESTRRQLVWINDASPNNISYAQLSQYRAFNLAKNALQDACGRVRQELETIEGDIYSDEANDLLKELEQTINSKEKESGSLYDLNQQLEAALQGMDMDADQLPREE